MAMHYFLVAPSSNSYHGREPLTYSFNEKLEVGQVVKITLRNRPLLGLVLEQTHKPEFATQPIINSLPNVVLPTAYVDLLRWISEYYVAPIGVSTSHFVPSFLDKIEVTSDPEATKMARLKKSLLPPLTSEQKNVIKQIKLNPSSSFILHGETGSGKTRVYLDLANQYLSSGKSVLIMTPEISLTSPLAKVFRTEIGEDNVLLIHSNLTPKQRRSVWETALGKSNPVIVIGPRSALFVPVLPGLIVVDESHDGAYSQESSPYYNALRLAGKLAALSGSSLVLGSATPLINEVYLADQKKMQRLRMIKPAIPLKQPPPKPQIIDLSDPDERTNQPLISKSLVAAIADNLEKNNQVLIFLNKRGSARSLLCEKCGWHGICDNCDIALTYHHDLHNLQCHLCGQAYLVPIKCPDCGHSDLLFKNPGTKAIELSLQKMFPNARVARFDKDNKKAERIEHNYADVVSGKIDILVGTQLLSKGHDLPKLGLVAILTADSGLVFPDYTTDEHFYQLIHQLQGRVNRGHVTGQVIVQTYHPENPLLAQALNGKWQEFYDMQLQTRRILQFPPFVHALKLVVSRSTRDRASEAAEKLTSTIKAENPRARIIGPAPAFVERQGGKNYWQLIVTSKNRRDLVKIAMNAPSGCRAELDPKHFL